MPSAAVPFINALQSGDEELAGASPQALNVTVDGGGAVRRRPGVSSFFTDGAGPTLGATGIWVAEDGTIFTAHPSAVSGAFTLELYRVTPGGSVLIGTMPATRRPTMAETEMLLVIAAGQAMRKIELASPSAVTLLGGSPPQASHVVANALRLAANDVALDRSAIRYSSTASGTTTYAGHEQWTIPDGTAGFFFANQAPDPIVAVAENTNELWVFGSRTLQVFNQDARFVWLPSITLEAGCVAPYSVVKREDQFYWLDHMRRFVRSNGRGTEVLSTGLQSVIQGLSTVSDCYGYRVLLGPVDGVAWTFPTEGRTFFMQEGSGWAEWTSWNGRQHSAWVVSGHGYNRLTGDNLVGVPLHGLAKLARGRATDLSTVSGQDPQPIIAEVTTGFINRGTDARKYCRSLRLTFRRGGSTRRPELRGFIRYRDTVGPWEPPIPVVLDGMQPVCEINSLGTYRRRQWKYSFSDETEDLVLTGAEEDFVVTD